MSYARATIITKSLLINILSAYVIFPIIDIIENNNIKTLNSYFY